MKLAAKIFLIIGMVVGFWMILPLVFGIITLSKMSKGQPVPTWLKICDLLFVNLIGGILLFFAED